MPKRILRQPQVLSDIGFSRATLYREVAAGRFPEPVKLSARCVGWYDDEIETWKLSRKSNTPEATHVGL